MCNNFFRPFRTQIRRGDQYRENKNEEKRKRKEMEAVAKMPPAYETALTHEIIKVPKEDDDSVEDLKVDTVPLLSD